MFDFTTISTALIGNRKRVQLPKTWSFKFQASNQSHTEFCFSTHVEAFSTYLATWQSWLLVQFWCSYGILPLYAIVTQMGSRLKRPWLQKKSENPFTVGVSELGRKQSVIPHIHLSQLQNHPLIANLLLYLEHPVTHKPQRDQHMDRGKSFNDWGRELIRNFK